MGNEGDSVELYMQQERDTDNWAEYYVEREAL
jgi:hypothetical protein